MAARPAGYTLRARTAEGPNMLPSVDIQCPYCGEQISLLIDGSDDTQQYIEDCQVCCRPIRVFAELDEDGALSVRVTAENEV